MPNWTCEEEGTFVFHVIFAACGPGVTTIPDTVILTLGVGVGVDTVTEVGTGA